MGSNGLQYSLFQLFGNRINHCPVVNVDGVGFNEVGLNGERPNGVSLIV